MGQSDAKPAAFMQKLPLTLVKPATVNGTVEPHQPPRRRPNAERGRESILPVPKSVEHIGALSRTHGHAKAADESRAQHNCPDAKEYDRIHCSAGLPNIKRRPFG